MKSISFQAFYGVRIIYIISQIFNIKCSSYIVKMTRFQSIRYVAENLTLKSQSSITKQIKDQQYIIKYCNEWEMDDISNSLMMNIVCGQFGIFPTISKCSNNLTHIKACTNRTDWSETVKLRHQIIPKLTWTDYVSFQVI